jgi:signal transduction histidine kinase
MIVGFGLTMLLLLGAAYVGYQGSRSIRDNAQDLIREHLIDANRAAAVELRIEQESQELLRELTWMLGTCFVLALAGSALTIWVTNRAFRRLEWQSDELNRVSWHMVDGHEKLARRFSHEIHDELGQALTGLRSMVKRMTPTDIESTRSEIVEVLEQVLISVRELSQLLRPVILDDFGLDAGLRWLTERFIQRTQIQVDYRSNFSHRLAEPIETHLFRIAQEALTNIARHSEATQARVQLEVDAARVRLTVEDNGRGMTNQAHRPRGLGMVGMRARARQLSGELRVDNKHEGGLRIQVEAPVARPQVGIQQEDTNFAG